MSDVSIKTAQFTEIVSMLISAGAGHGLRWKLYHAHSREVTQTVRQDILAHSRGDLVRRSSVPDIARLRLGPLAWCSDGPVEGRPLEVPGV